MTLSQIGMSQTYLAFGIDNPVGIWRDLILIDMKIGKLPKLIKIRLGYKQVGFRKLDEKVLN